MTMLSDSPIQKHNEQIDMSHHHEASGAFSCSMVGWVARAACAEVSTGAREASKASMAERFSWTLRIGMNRGIHGRIIYITESIHSSL
jgi:hypothetical protein